MKIIFVYYLSTLLISCYVTADHTDDLEIDWHYHTKYARGPQDWHIRFPECGGDHQSPVDIANFRINENRNYGAVHFHVGEDWDNAEMINNGYYIQIVLKDKSKATTMFTKGCLDDHSFVLEEIRLHWGGNSFRGSEHRLKGFMCAMELQLLTNRKKDGGSRYVGAKPFAGLAFLFDESADEEIPELEVLAETALGVLEVDDKMDCNVTGLLHYLFDFLCNHSKTYYCYSGSATTPPCLENYLWLVYPQKLPISIETLSILRRTEGMEVHHRQIMKDNFREPQPLYNRNITKVNFN